MSHSPPWLEIQTHRHEPIEWQGWRVTPQTRIVRVRVPFWPAGFVWVRPVRVGVEGPGRPAGLLPVRDLTRVLLVGWWVLVLAGLCLAWWIGRRPGGS